MPEFYIVTALPYSVAHDATHHVSLYIAPRIVSGVETELGRWNLFPNWADRVRSATIELTADVGVIECDAIRDPVDPTVWLEAFPPSTPVRDSQVPDWDEPDRRWRSFSAGGVLNIAKALHMAAIYAGPTSPPPPSSHPLSRAIAGRVRTLDGYSETQMTRLFDRVIESDLPLAAIDEIVGSERDWLNSIGMQLHRCRRFYERPESQGPYREHPDPDATEPTAVAPEPEFHQRCSTVGNMPALQRMLGLVIDLRVTDLDLLRTATWLSARMLLDGDASAYRATRVRCRTVGEDLVSVAKTNDWSDGALRLGDDELFTVLDVDTDGSALKMDRFIWTLPRLMRCQADGQPVNAATPALRSGGFTVARNRQALNIQERLRDQRRLAAAMIDQREPSLHTEDITRGMRVEVWDHSVARWRSVHEHLADIHVGDTQVLEAHPEEGFVQVSAVHETGGVDRSPLHVHEALFGWEGWSLSVPRPGKRIVRREGQEFVEDTPTDYEGEPTHPIRSIARSPRGTLPRLRYGRAYAFRAWAVDLAGNSRPHNLTSGAPLASGGMAVNDRWPELRAATLSVMRSEQPQTRLSLRSSAVTDAIATALSERGQAFVADTSLGRSDGIVTGLRPFLRWDPVLSPAVVPRHQYTEGESLRVLVIRSDVTQDVTSGTVVVASSTATSERHLAPPKTSQIGAELHGKFDTAIGSTDPAEQQRMLGWILCEDGTFNDPTRADIDNPPDRLKQEGFGLASNGDQYTLTPKEEFVELKEEQFEHPETTEAKLPANQYVVHNIDEVTLPYLPDPLAKGVSIVFPDAGADRTIMFPFGSEGVTADYDGDWPVLAAPSPGSARRRSTLLERFRITRSR